MTDTDGPFDGKPWSEAQWARHAAAWAPSGVYGPPAASTTTGDLPLSVSGLSVGLGAGRAWVRGFGFERTGAAVMQAVSANTHGSFSRRDRIVLRRNLATHTVTPVLLTGAPAGSPAAPTLTQSDAGSWDLPMFSFLVPPNSGTSITGFIDERVWVDPNGGSPMWESFTPTFTSEGGAPAVGNGTLLGRRQRHGSTVTFRISFTFGSTSNAGTGGLLFALPFPAVNDGSEQDVLAKAFTSDGRPWAGAAYIPSGSTTVRPYLPKGPTPDLGWARGADASGAPGTGIPLVSGDFPFKAGSILVICGTYEAA